MLALKAGRARRRGSLLEYIVIAVIVALVLSFSIFIPGFATLGNLRVIASNSAALVILSCGMGMVIISRGLDLSLVATMVAGATVFALSSDSGIAWPLALGLALLAVGVIGFINGWLIAYVEISAMLATLASAMVVTGFFRYVVLGGEYLLLLPKTNPAVIFFSGDIVPGLSAPVALMIVSFVLTAILLRTTTFGRITYAMGDNFQAARLTGLPVRTTTLMIYVYAAVMALLAGLVTAAPDDLDWEDEIRQALESRAALSPDALTGLEANLRFGINETLETRVFGRLSAWQNWIFIRPNAVGANGALKVYGTGAPVKFNWERV